MFLQLCNKLLHTVTVILACYKPANGAALEQLLISQSEQSCFWWKGWGLTGGLQVPEEREEDYTGATEALLQG